MRYVTFHLSPCLVSDLMQIIRKICDLCNILLSLSCDEIALLYKRAQSISRYLIDFVVKDSLQI